MNRGFNAHQKYCQKTFKPTAEMLVAETQMSV